VPPGPPPLWFGKAELSFLSTSGNTDTSSLGGALELNYNPKPWLFTLKGSVLHAATDGITTAETYTASAKASRDLTERLDVFVGGGWLRNRFSGIQNLWNFDGGAGTSSSTDPPTSCGSRAGRLHERAGHRARNHRALRQLRERARGPRLQVAVHQDRVVHQ
jgi:putative salt-induced outer membrane protein YdiY